MNTLSKIQASVKAPKGQFNNFGRYKYRSCEDIVEAVKPVINPLGFYLVLSDQVVNIGGRFYIEATAMISNGEETFFAKALAREEESKKGMDGAQVTGAASSYARKYALNGLFAIDDTKDSDTTNDGSLNDVPAESERKLLRTLVYNSTLDDKKKEEALATIEGCSSYKLYEQIQHRLESLQQPIDQIPNPNQGDINKHLKKTIA